MSESKLYYLAIYYQKEEEPNALSNPDDAEKDPVKIYRLCVKQDNILLKKLSSKNKSVSIDLKNQIDQLCRQLAGQTESSQFLTVPLKSVDLLEN